MSTTFELLHGSLLSMRSVWSHGEDDGMVHVSKGRWDLPARNRYRVHSALGTATGQLPLFDALPRVCPGYCLAVTRRALSHAHHCQRNAALNHSHVHKRHLPRSLTIGCSSGAVIVILCDSYRWSAEMREMRAARAREAESPEEAREGRRMRFGGGGGTGATIAGIISALCSLGLLVWRVQVRGRLRQEFNIPPGCCGPCDDFCTHCFCESCALAQEGAHVDLVAREQVRPFSCPLAWVCRRGKAAAGTPAVRGDCDVGVPSALWGNSARVAACQCPCRRLAKAHTELCHPGRGSTSAVIAHAALAAARRRFEAATFRSRPHGPPPPQWQCRCKSWVVTRRGTIPKGTKVNRRMRPT